MDFERRKATPCAARLSGVESLSAMWETTAVQSLHESEAASANMAEVMISTLELEGVTRSCPAQFDVMRLSILNSYANLGGYLHRGVLSKVDKPGSNYVGESYRKIHDSASDSTRNSEIKDYVELSELSVTLYTFLTTNMSRKSQSWQLRLLYFQ